MKIYLPLLLMSFLLISCNDDSQSFTGTVSEPSACANSGHVGQYLNDANGEFMNLYPDCTGDTVLCNQKFIWDEPVSQQTTVTILTSNGGPGCIPAGTYSCSTDLSTTQFLLTCEGFPMSVWTVL
jgi:hypothetical protein